MGATCPTQFDYSRWRHGGWYVHNVRYPSGACGCVSRNYEDRKWRIACDPRPFEARPTFKNRDEAAAAEWRLAREQALATPWLIEVATSFGWAGCGWAKPSPTEADAIAKVEALKARDEQPREYRVINALAVAS